MARRRWIQIDGRLVEVSANVTVSDIKRRPSRAPTVMTDTIKPYWNAHVGKWVNSRAEHKRILRENGLIELGNEKDAWIREIQNPDFSDDGKPVWRDQASEADERILQENSEWLAKNTSTAPKPKP